MNIKDRLSESQLENLSQIQDKVKVFVQKFKGQKIIFLTSGGTSVPLQQRAVRFIENFSTGTRGSLVGQQILQRGYPLIFFYRDRTYIPFLQGLTATNIALQQGQQKLKKLVQGKQKLKKCADRVLMIPFFSIYFYLEGITKIKQLLPPKSIVILCAAVSDFIPNAVFEHKIHTTSDFKLELTNVPKILGSMTGKQVLCVSFKLQTDLNRVDERMEYSLKNYNVDMVIGNLLGEKNWIKVKFNENSMGKNEDIQYNQNVQYNIVQAVLQGWKHKFEKEK